MKRFCFDQLNKLEEDINENSLNENIDISSSEKAITLIFKHLAILKQYVIKNDFKNEDEEIYFFKNLKPKFIAKIIFYNAIYKIEVKKPYGTKNVIEQYINNELSKLKRFYDNNLDFYKYYRTNSTYLDHKYFVRGKHEIKLGLDSYYFEADHNFSTSHDFKVAKIIANDLIQIFLENQLRIINEIDIVNEPKMKLQWTASKTALTELIYALYSQGVFEHGNADIRLIAKYFESTFNVDLGNFYQTYLELRNRKMNRTKFLDALREELIKKMDDQDEK
ncbi:RteC domain-containing protein [Sphingobacterium corticibacter]|uniref:Tetracycline regulation of excision, RteC n=1 Tax=Sphingobacterium corticibacter TaxID=2171749 RepID=A0A2T8HGE3_9SPHI|nr:RteC domain-containing protein [Sphingobacterium corticibacter]PVH24519.1 tetracycline regulation of excision, RteC [Sphingobacterium corticibacter]